MRERENDRRIKLVQGAMVVVVVVVDGQAAIEIVVVVSRAIEKKRE